MDESESVACLVSCCVLGGNEATIERGGSLVGARLLRVKVLSDGCHACAKLAKDRQSRVGSMLVEGASRML
jgi:hypothetical protein